MRCNKLFTTALEQYGITDDVVASTPLGDGLEELLREGLVERNSCLAFGYYAHNLETSPWEDQIGREAWANRFHIEDHEPQLSSLRDQVIQALKLVSEFPTHLPDTQSRDVLITISVDDPDFCPEVEGCGESLPSCVVRFHQVWPDQTFLDEDLEAYQHEALATFRVSARVERSR